MWLPTAFIDVTQYENLMNEVSEDTPFLRGDLLRVHTRYVQVVDPNMPDIINNATRVKYFIGILKLLRSEAEYTNSLFTKTEGDHQESLTMLVSFIKIT